MVSYLKNPISQKILILFPSFLWLQHGSSLAPGAFAALLDTGSVLCWGHRDLGGAGPGRLEGVTRLVATNGAFAAVLAEAVVTWGSVFAGEGGGEFCEFGLMFFSIFFFDVDRIL